MRAHGAQRGEGRADRGSENTPACCLPCVPGASWPGARLRKSSESWVRGAPWGTSGWWAHGGAWAVWIPGLLAPVSNSCTHSISLLSLGATGGPWGVSSGGPLPLPTVSPQPTLGSSLREPRWAWGQPRGLRTPGRGLAPAGTPARQPPECERGRPCVKASLSALYKAVGHAAVPLAAAARCYYPLPARRGRCRTPRPGIIVLLGYKLPLPAGPFA